jgi:hypothetical protein
LEGNSRSILNLRTFDTGGNLALWEKSYSVRYRKDLSICICLLEVQIISRTPECIRDKTEYLVTKSVYNNYKQKSSLHFLIFGRLYDQHEPKQLHIPFYLCQFRIYLPETAGLESSLNSFWGDFYN